MSDPLSTQAATDLLGQLIATASVNPNHQPPAGPGFGEAVLAGVLADRLEQWGASVEIRDVLPGRPNLVARFAGRDASRSLMFEAHGDTVSAEGMTIDPFNATVTDGRMFGRGACDTKGPMAAMLLGIRAALDRHQTLPTDVYFVSTCDEELGCTGAHALVAEGFRVDAAVVAEPTDLKIVHAHKGAIRWIIETLGRAGHSSNPAGGVNAISQMRKVLDVLEGPIAESLAQQSHPLLGAPTLCVGTIAGGSQVNVIPDRCRIEVDRRTLPGGTAEQAIAQITDALDALAAADPAFIYQWQQREYYPPLDQACDSPVATLVADVCQAVLGSAELTCAPWAATAGVFDTAGIPSVLFGPGSIAQAHTKDEWIELAQVVQAAEVYAHMIDAFADAPIGADR